MIDYWINHVENPITTAGIYKAMNDNIEAIGGTGYDLNESEMNELNDYVNSKLESNG